jgi:hypothetical protein
MGIRVNHDFLFLFLFIKGKYTVHAEIVTPEEKRVACLIGQTVFPRH